LHLDPAEGSSDSTNNPQIKTNQLKISVRKTNLIQPYAHLPTLGDQAFSLDPLVAMPRQLSSGIAELVAFLASNRAA
jgi:hypothetical protein